MLGGGGEGGGEGGGRGGSNALFVFAFVSLRRGLHYITSIFKSRSKVKVIYFHIHTGMYMHLNSPNPTRHVKCQ